MNQADALEITQLAMWTLIVASSPAVIAAMGVGLSIALLQALTQIQEVTLTFIPKIIAIFLAVTVFSTFIGSQVGRLSTTVYAYIQSGF